MIAPLLVLIVTFLQLYTMVSWCIGYFLYAMLVLAQGQTQGSAPRVHQQALTTGPFGNTCEADAVSPEAAMGGLQDRDVYNQGEYQVDLILEQYNMHISLIILDLLHTTIYQI
jgi:hypothetical protein